MNTPEQDAVPRFARVGYVAKGVTYALMGFLALRAAIGGGQAGGTRRALAMLNGPLVGRVAVALIALGLAAYASWRLYVAITNPEDDSVLQRIGIAGIGLVNGGLAVQAGLLVLHSARSSGRDSAAYWSELIMRYPYGVWIVGAAGAALSGYGAWQLFRAITSKLDSALRLGAMQRDFRKAAVAASRFGIAARGVVFVLIGLFVIDAARDSDPGDAKDFGRTLQSIQEQPFGPVLLGIVAMGLIAYALYEFVRARYRIFRTR